MSKRTYLGVEGETERVVIDRDNECNYKVNSKCCNNRNLRWLGKVCRYGKECNYYEIEKGVEGWKERKQ